MSVCGALLLPSDHSTQKNLECQQLSPLEREFRQLDECRSWSLFYERIQNLASVESCQLTLSAANEVGNRWKNRYRDIIPYDETRVLLKSESTGDYINANFVKVKEVPSRRYILTQGPLLQTAGHFWQMVVEQKCPVIIMLNRFTEKGALKCFNYFPDHAATLNFPDANCSVTCVLEENKGLYTLRTLEVVNVLTNLTHEVLHFHYTRWPDFGVPEYSSSMLNLLWDVRRTGALDDPDRPGIVHCSAGVGRSGTFVLMDIALSMIEKQNSMEGVNLPQLLIQLRQCRMGIIQTAQQLRYCYLAVIEGGKILLSTPPEERAALVFSEHNHISADENGESDSDDEISSEEEDVESNHVEATEVDIQDDKRKIIRHLRMCAAKRGVALHPNYLCSLNSSSSASTDEEDEVEIRELFNQSCRKPNRYHHFLNQNHFPPLPIEVEEVQGGEIEESIVMSHNSLPVQSNESNQLEEDALHQPLPVIVVPGVNAPSSLATQAEPSVEGKEEGKKEAGEAKAEELEKLELIRQLREARLARQAQTRARLAEITARMAEKNMLRHRWLPERIAQPLRTFFTRTGFFSNLTEAVLFVLGIFSFLAAVSLGLWWRHRS
ncbi:tyrosine protein phosphatase non receptor type [Echinococcus multilocularis]|uniref:protein-tyrosine-phosphatase n=1 Tax=Echinococcus multilocularis TaxID=6211 RepID=A0A068Y5K5_ECHMU|nr:tyrosine protein phosphatase non receptor type [Echinococcus multilocularis]